MTHVINITRYEWGRIEAPGDTQEEAIENAKEIYKVEGAVWNKEELGFIHSLKSTSQLSPEEVWAVQEQNEDLLELITQLKTAVSSHLEGRPDLYDHSDDPMQDYEKLVWFMKEIQSL